MRTEYCAEFLSVFCRIVLGISFIRDDVHCLEHFVAAVVVHGIVFLFALARFAAVVDALPKPFACVNNNNYGKHKSNENKKKKNLNKKRAIHAGYLGFYICFSLLLLNFIQAFMLIQAYTSHTNMAVEFEDGEMGSHFQQYACFLQIFKRFND